MLRPFFIILRAQLLEEMGRYAEAADFIRNVLDRPFSLSIGNMPIQLVEAVVDEESPLADDHCHGSIGIAAVLQHRKTILNFRDMFVKFE